MSKTCLSFIWIIVVTIAFSLETFCIHAQAKQEYDPKAYYESFEEFVKVVKEIQDKHVNEVGLEELMKNAYRGMLAGLDPYSQFIDSENLKELKIETGGEFSGLGIEVIIKGGVLIIITPIVDTPAFRAGILIGDKVLKIDGKSTRSITIRDTVKMLRGKIGTEVTLTVLHDGESETVDITIKRAKIHVKSVRGARIIDEESKIGYMAITNFQENTVDDMDKAAYALMKQGLKALILDLRFNPGGLLSIARDMADRFIKKGVIVSTRGRHRSQEHEYKAHKAKTYPDFPLIILVNKGSASASEIVAGAVKDHGRGILVGTNTFGKGSVQTLIPIEDRDTALKLTTAKYYTPSGAQIEETGIEPDVKVELTKKELRELHSHLSMIHAADISTENGKRDLDKNESEFVDAQLAKAVDILKGKIAYAQAEENK